MRPHDVSGACHTLHGAPSPCRRSERRASARLAGGGNRLATGPGELFTPSEWLFLGPVSRAGTAVEAAGIRGKLRRSRRRTVPPPPLGGLFFNPGFASRRAKTCVPRKTLDAVGPGTVRHPPRRLHFLPARLDVRIPHLPSSGSHAPDQVPDSVTDIDRPAAVPIHRGAMMPRSCSSI